MRNFLNLLVVALLSGILTLAGYIFLTDKPLAHLPAMAAPVSVPTVQTAMSEPAMDFTAAAENTVHAVVHVKNLSYRSAPSNPILEYFYGYRGGQEQAQIGTGSGVIISEDGYIVTNNHVIDRASELQVTLNNNKSYPAKLIGSDQAMDIALLKIDTGEKMPYVVFGDSDQIQLGEWVLAVGNPYNLTSTVTAGIISAKARNLSKSGIQSFIQTDAVVNPGNSGGALVNSRGELIGINTMISSNTGSYVGYSFAVPSNVTRKIIEDLLEFGNVQQGVLGIQGYEINSLIAKEKQLQTDQGFYVEAVVENSGAERSGLRSGDIITQINQRPINTFVDLNSVLNTKRPNDKVTLNLLRSAKQLTLEVSLSKPHLQNVDFNGFELEALSESDYKKLNLQYGLRIKKVSNPSYAAYRSELEGSILRSINGTPMESLSQAKSLLNTNRNGKFRFEIVNKEGERLRLLL